MGGKAIWKINNMVWGIDLVEEQLMTVCGIPTQPLIAKHPLANIAEYTVNVHKSGIIEHVEFIEVGPPCAVLATGACLFQPSFSFLVNFCCPLGSANVG